jgi:hypothetical protein
MSASDILLRTLKISKLRKKLANSIPNIFRHSHKKTNGKLIKGKFLLEATNLKTFTFFRRSSPSGDAVITVNSALGINLPRVFIIAL